MKKIREITIRVVLISILLFLCFSNTKVHAGFFNEGIFKGGLLDIDWDHLLEWHWPWDNDDEEDDESEESEAISTAINNENGGLFESTIANALGGIAQAVFNITTSDELDIGFKDYDELIFNKSIFYFNGAFGVNTVESGNLSPFDDYSWSKIMNWYKIFTLLSGIPILIGVIITSYKFITAGTSISRRNDAKESFMRLFLGGVAIALAPVFVKLLLYINSSMITILTSGTNGGLNKILGNRIFTQIKTGSAIATALVICLFAYLFIKFNIKFIIRKFTLIVFIVFTPLIAGMWIINKNVTGAAIWFGQIFINVFMQFIYAFLFLIYMSFTAVADGWATALLWAMMILPLGDVLLNTMQNLVSRIAGVNNDEIANRGIGMAAGMAYTVHSIGSQFISNRKENNSQRFSSNRSNIDNSSHNQDNGFTSVVTGKRINLGGETNNNDISNNMNTNKINNVKNNTNQMKTKKTGFSLYGIGRSFLNAGMFMAEGRNFNTHRSGDRRNYGQNMRKDEQVTSAINDEKSDENEK